jgi:hypothetical protein
MKLDRCNPRLVLADRAANTAAYRTFQVSTNGETGISALCEMRAQNTDPLVLAAIEVLIAEKRFITAWLAENPVVDEGAEVPA